MNTFETIMGDGSVLTADGNNYSASRHGVFIVHRAIRQSHHGWTILHIPTKHTVAFNFPTREAARNCAKAMAKSYDFRFDSMNVWASSDDETRIMLRNVISQFMGEYWLRNPPITPQFVLRCEVVGRLDVLTRSEAVNLLGTMPKISIKGGEDAV